MACGQREVALHQKYRAGTSIQSGGKGLVGRIAPKREAYYFQIGLDFGTSYCKVVCREIFKNRAWVHSPRNPAIPERPFLLPSALRMQNGKLSLGSALSHYHDSGLPHVKFALVKAAEGNYSHDVVAPFAKVLRSQKPEAVKTFVCNCAIYLLGGILSGIKDEISERYPDYGEHDDDYIAVSLAVPVADAEKQVITQLFREVLYKAFTLSSSLSCYPSITPSRLDKLIRTVAVFEERDEYRFFVYPEVSAGVQGFVRSRVSSDGIYLFSETGAATVDQSVFILFRPKGADAQLTYLSAKVLMLGSSQIELRAANLDGGVDFEKLERWRRLKEQGKKSEVLARAGIDIGQALKNASWNTLGLARRKLTSKRQFEDLRLLFGGGGHLRNPYERYVLDVFDEVNLHGSPFKPQVVNLPVPNDLEPSQSVGLWMNRLWIAYGLSFYPGDYPNHQYPSETPDAVPVEPRRLPDAVRQEDC